MSLHEKSSVIKKPVFFSKKEQRESKNVGYNKTSQERG